MDLTTTTTIGKPRISVWQCPHGVGSENVTIDRFHVDGT